MVKRGFASDNNAGVHPEILKELAVINTGHVIGYGSDIYTGQAIQLFKNHLGSDTEVFFVFTEQLLMFWASVVLHAPGILL
jgi:threonine aldolase